MPRYLSDEFELPDDDDLPYEGKLYRRPRRSPIGLFIVFAALVMVAGGVASFFYVGEQQRQDATCLACHTPPHQAYLDRAQASVGGALAPDLSSFHYQQIRGGGGDIRCIDCHRGNDSLPDRAATMLLSLRMTARWLAGANDVRIEKTAITTTVINGVTQTVPQTTLALREPALTNASCIACHQEQLLIAGLANHMHNMLPAVYDAWKNGARLIAPKDAPDPQAVIAQGLMRFETTVQCTACHQAHRTMDTNGFLDLQNVVKPACEQCHRETGSGPTQVTIQEKQ